MSDLSLRMPSFEPSMLSMLLLLSLASIDAGARAKYEDDPWPVSSSEWCVPLANAPLPPPLLWDAEAASPNET